MGEQAAAAPSAGSEARALDLSQPTKFTPDLRRRIAAAIEPCCEELSTTLSAELKTESRIALTDSEQHTWAAAKSRLPADTVAVALRHEGAEAALMLVSVELPLVLQSLECLLGGSAAQAPESRHLSDIDWALAGAVFETIARELSAAWEELGGAPLALGEVDLEDDAGIETPPSEPTLVLAFESEIEGVASGISLLLPWSALAPLAPGLAATGAPAGAPRSAREAGILRRGLSAAQILLRAEVGSLQMPIDRMLELAPGMVLELAERAEEGVRLFAEEVSLGRGEPGRSGTRRALKLTAADEVPVRAQTYAKLGRGELERARVHHRSVAGRGGPPILQTIFVRVWAELGRTHMPLGRALDLAHGAVVELDQDAQAPVELFANGLCFATGELVVTPEGRWGVRVAALV